MKHIRNQIFLDGLFDIFRHKKQLSTLRWNKHFIIRRYYKWEDCKIDTTRPIASTITRHPSQAGSNNYSGEYTFCRQHIGIPRCKQLYIFSMFRFYEFTEVIYRIHLQIQLQYLYWNGNLLIFDNDICFSN